MDNPIYDALVVKHYLSKGIVPFSYPHEPIVAGYTIPSTDTHGNTHIRFDLRVVDNHIPGRPRTPYDRPRYFNL